MQGHDASAQPLVGYVVVAGPLENCDQRLWIGKSHNRIGEVTVGLSFPAEVVSSKSPTPSREDGAPARAPSSLSAIAQMLVSTIMVGWALLSLQGQSPVALFRSGSFDDPALGWFAVVATTTPVAVALLWRALSGCTEAKMLRVFYVAEGAGGLIAAFLIGVFSVLRQ